MKTKAERVRARKLKRMTFAAFNRCVCGAGLATVPSARAWDCSAIILGDAIERGYPGAVKHTPLLPFVFYEIKSEWQPSAHGASTRPPA